MDVNVGDILIVIEAHHYAERITNAEAIVRSIKKSIMVLLKGSSMSTAVVIILKLVHISSAEFTIAGLTS
jgi:multidrug resistance efflux pump